MLAITFFLFAVVAPSGPGRALAQNRAITLQAYRAQDGSLVVGSDDTRSNVVHTVSRSTNLVHWTELAQIHDAPFHLAQPPPGFANAFYRAGTRTRTSADDFRNHVRFPLDPFTQADPDTFDPEPDPRWIKFIIRLDDPDRVIFQDSRKYTFHVDFATRRLPEFQGLTSAQFDARTLHRANQAAVVGAVLFPPGPGVQEFGIQFTGRDPYPREDVARWFEAVRAAVETTSGPARAFYMPAYEQLLQAERDAAWLDAAGIPLGSVERWLSTDLCYAPGWALGRLVHLPASELDEALADGRLTARDILLVDQVPAEMPFVAGIITLAAATPNSHVAILAGSLGIPFVWPSSPAVRSNLLAWNGREIALRTALNRCEVEVVQTQDTLPTDVRDELLKALEPAPLHVTPTASLGSISTNAAQLRPADVRFVGGKAAHFGLLRRTIPANSPEALALTFDLWNSFMDQTLPEGITLRNAIRQRLALLANVDIGRLQAGLEEIRTLIVKTARFSDADRSRVLEALSGFDPGRNLRFRSSTNVEDTEAFVGAGLYDSYSGCMADDLDDDTAGPSRCDPTESAERGVFRAIQKVYASFYNNNAFLERRRRRVDESQVGMAILVHHSYPDTVELANGVATLEYIRYDFGGAGITYKLVTQDGAVSVTNPDTPARAEVVVGSSDETSQIFLTQRESSSLVPLGGTVMRWTSEYTALGGLLRKVMLAYRAAAPQLTHFILDFEYKKIEPSLLEIKQVRRLPLPPEAAPLTVLLNQPQELVLLQGEHGTTLGLHRLKSRWHFETRSARLQTNAGPAPSLYTNLSVITREDGVLASATQGPGTWEGHSHRITAETPRAYVDSWRTGAGSLRRTLELRTYIDRFVYGEVTPLVTQTDFRRELTARYDTPQPEFDYDVVLGSARASTTRDDAGTLVPRMVRSAESLLQSRDLRSGRVRIQTRFYWPKPPTGPTAGYTAPVEEWVETVISGLTPDPMVLRREWAQTYHPAHHNFAEDFAFEPRLDEGVPAAQLETLAAANIRILVVSYDPSGSTVFWVVGVDNKLRRLNP